MNNVTSVKSKWLAIKVRKDQIEGNKLAKVKLVDDASSKIQSRLFRFVSD